MDIPTITRDERSAPFFDAAASEALLIKRCRACGSWLGPEAGGCPDCGATGAGGPRWERAAGHGILISWAVVHHGPARTGAAAADAPPAMLALVELDEGPWLRTRLETGDPAALRAGDPVRAHFAHPADGESYPYFRLTSEPGHG
jgi:uncharacterized OB-fold protein